MDFVQKTVVLVKPDGVKRGLVGEILSRFEKRGLKIIALDMILANKEEIDSHYPKDEIWIKRLGEKSMSNYRQYSVDPKDKLGTDDPLEIGQMIRKWVKDGRPIFNNLFLLISRVPDRGRRFVLPLPAWMLETAG